MSHYQARLERDLARIRGEIAEIGDTVATAVHNAVKALLTHNRALAAETILGDHAINRRIRRLDRDCYAFVARHLPSAGHLRFVSSALRLSLGLERIGDYAATIGREAAQMTGEPPAAVARDIELLATQSGNLLRQAMRAWHESNAELARGTQGMAGQVTATVEKVIADLIEAGEKGSHSLRDLFALLSVFNRLSRVSSQAKNICEETLFTVAGETKKPKVYPILFVDEKDDSYTQMAVAYARKAYPESGSYESAGYDAAEELEPRCALFLDEHGYDPAKLAPKELDATHEGLSRYHAVVSLGGDVRSRIVEVPFHTILLEWEAGPPVAELDQERAGELLAESYREIAHRVQGLMEALRGPEAD